MKTLHNSENNQELQYIHESLERILAQLTKLQRSDPSQVFFDNQQFIQIMNISKRTCQNWREQNLIAYSQIGNKFYYKLSDILSLLNNFYKPSNN